MALALAILPCLHFLELGTEAAIRRGLEVNATKELLAAVTAVLKSCCDVVVELDSEGSIMSPAWDLGVFLLRGRSCNLQTTQFTNLLADEEEKSIFLKKLGTPKATDLGVAEALHLRMRDADGCLLQVEVFTCPFRHLNGQARNLVGVRESLRMPASGTEAQLAHRHQQPNTVAGGVDPTASSDDERAPSVASSQSNHSAQSCSSDTRDDPWAAMLIVDSTSDRLSICGCSPGFLVRVGRLAPTDGLMDVVKEAEDFAQWMKMAAIYGADWPKSRVTLNLRQGFVRATVGATHEEDDGSVDRKHVQLLFSKITKSKVLSDGCTRFRPHTNYRGTPVLHMTL
uniref:Uncharacterized protein n=1 Tax=Alexandrium catenella TaxID=2925 RepID=A0A7S1RF06_ALECA|mmetsp:Transcript_555/g.1533  ORF Transcript_555/g.1533 Transcript_555/m.1533 type:complete len:341 (+) Transcript_555:1-1023(+)